MPTLRSTQKGKKCFLWWVSTSVWPQGVTQHHIFIKFFFDFARIFSLIFRTSNFWSLRNLIKMRLVIAISALRASLAIYHLISNKREWNNYRLTHSASELSGFTCTSSLTMNEKFQYRTRPPSAVLKISSSLLVNECKWMSALTFLLFKLNTL